MRVLVLGSSGFVGRHVAQELVSRGHEVEGWSRSPTHGPGLARERLVDLSEPSSFQAARGPWDAAILLAGNAVPGPEFDARAATSNARIARHALEHLARTSAGARVVVMSSAHVYGETRNAETLLETRALSPNGPYGASKLEIEGLARQSSTVLDVVIVRSFNQIGPRMPRGLLIPDLLDAFGRGLGPVMMRGPDGVRDFLDVRDGARALSDLIAPVQTGARAPGEMVFNLCSGVGMRVSELARGLAERLSIRREIRFAPGSPAPFVGSHAALTQRTGWVPVIALDDTLAWIARETGASA